jgi:hypothetical protein
MRQKGIEEAKISQTVFPPCFEAAADDEEEDEEVGEEIAIFNEQSKPSKQRRLNSKGKEKADGGGGVRGEGGRGGAEENDLIFAEIPSSQLPAQTASKKAQDPPFPPFPMDNKLASSSSSSLKGPSMLPSATIIDLPPPDELRKLTTVFLHATYMFALFQPQRLFERLAKGRGHEDYPKDVVLHMICAFAYADRVDTIDIQSLPSKASLKQCTMVVKVEDISTLLESCFFSVASSMLLEIFGRGSSPMLVLCGIALRSN